MIEPFMAAFSLALISEIADKTQLVILGLALKYKSPFKVFSGALLAHASMDGIAIMFGTFFGFSVPVELIKMVTGVTFISLGLWTIFKIYLRKSGKSEKGVYGKNPFKTTFFMVLLGEFGDKTQIAAGLLAAKYLAPLPVLAGFVLALAAAIGVNVFAGRKIAEKMPRKTIKLVTAALFISFGIATLAV